ncbi:hypothetical protein WG908_15740 [Sphingobium sp. AN641]|uniref:hypothetical protein n=1 Tax=Sphingobium sp. AN641 TaxID=3133443 RepID=UPI0030C43984
MAAGSWQLDIRTDRFSGDVVCRLRGKRLLYLSGAVGFRFGHRASVMDAWVRIDNGPAMRWRDQLPELARLRVPIDGADMDVPTDGIVWLPAQLIDNAGIVAIQPVPGKGARSFDIAGFRELLAAGRRAGCDPEARFAL